MTLSWVKQSVSVVVAPLQVSPDTRSGRSQAWPLPVLAGSVPGLLAMALTAVVLALALFAILRGWGVPAFHRLG